MAAAAATPLLFSPTNPKSKAFFPTIKPLLSLSTPYPSSNFISSTSLLPALQWNRRTVRFLSCSTVQDVAVAEEGIGAQEGGVKEEEEEEKGEENRRKLYVANLPWNFSAPDIQKLFGECGTVKDVEIIKQLNGKSRGFAFVTMSSGEEAFSVIEKFDSYELMGRIIRVEFSKSFRKPARPAPPGTPKGETRHKLYAGNLAWKARSADLKSFFSEKFNPVATRVVFDTPSGKSAGYGFISFATQEEAEAALSEMDGKELLGRPIRLKISQKKDVESGGETEKRDDTEGESEEPENRDGTEGESDESENRDDAEGESEES